MFRYTNLKDYNTFKISAISHFFAEPQSWEEVFKILQMAREMGWPLVILGNGSNIILDDTIPFDTSFFIKIGSPLDRIEIESRIITVESGALIDNVAWKAAEKGLLGLEGICGIPGTIGGAVYMNASFTKPIANFIVGVKVIDLRTGEEKWFSRVDCNFGYRSSIFHNKFFLIYKVVLELVQGEKRKAIEALVQNLKRRGKTQPLEYPSCGSIFKGVGIKEFAGLRYGDAEVSKLCPSFIINKGKASYSDILQIISHIQKARGNNLELEAEIISERGNK